MSLRQVDFTLGITARHAPGHFCCFVNLKLFHFVDHRRRCVCGVRWCWRMSAAETEPSTQCECVKCRISPTNLVKKRFFIFICLAFGCFFPLLGFSHSIPFSQPPRGWLRTGLVLWMNVAHFQLFSSGYHSSEPKHGLLFSFFGPDSNANQYVIDSFFFGHLRNQFNTISRKITDGLAMRSTKLNEPT